MEFHVAQILREPVGYRRDFRVFERCEAEAPASPSFPVEGQVSLLRTDAGILATADVTSVVDVTCSRCLVPAQLPVELHVEEEYYPTVDVVTGARLSTPKEPTPFLIDEHHILSLCEAMRQQLVVAEPMQPLCKDDCAGLCQVCGQDRNRGSCACASGELDARWAALGGFLRASS